MTNNDIFNNMNRGNVIIGRALMAVCYVGLLLMFAYTSLFNSVFVKGETDFLSAYNEVQSSWVSFVVNIGLLLMLLIDFVYDKTNIPRWLLVFSILTFGFLSLVFYFAGHAVMVSGYNRPFRWPWFGVVLYCVFVVYLMIVKYFSLPCVIINQEIKETY